jgi:SAM-dependent methyltransferase
VTDPFGASYAGSYDALYEEKDYAGEVDAIDGAIRRDGRPDARTILDLGCGTGRHAILLVQRGYDVVGVDRSPAMLAIARQRAATAGREIEFLEGDVRSVDLGRTFDAVLLMFAVLGYQLTDEDVARTIETVARHLRPGGLLLFDVWYGPAVETEGPTERTKVVQDGSRRIERNAVGVLDPRRNTCTVRYTLRITGNEQPTETSEEHTVRYFFESDLRTQLERAGLSLIKISAFPDVERPADATSWNAFAVARAG